MTPADLAAAVPARRPSVTAPDVRENDDAFETAIIVIAVELVILAVDPTDAGEDHNTAEARMVVVLVEILIVARAAIKLDLLLVPILAEAVVAVASERRQGRQR